MLLNLEWTGDNSASSEITFYTLKNLLFRNLTLRSVDVDVSNAHLSQEWDEYTEGVEAPTRTVYAPLYLTITGVGHEDVMTQRSREDASLLIPLGTSQPQTVRQLDLKLINDTLTHWPSGTPLVLTLHKRSVETAGTYAAPAALTGTEFDDASRCLVVLELDEGAHHAVTTTHAARSSVVAGNTYPA